MSEAIVRVVATSHVRHNGVHYAPGATIQLREVDARRLVELGVARVVEEPAPPTPPAPPQGLITAAAIVDMPVKEVVPAIASITDVSILEEILKTDGRKTVVEAARARIAELRDTGTPGGE